MPSTPRLPTCFAIRPVLLALVLASGCGGSAGKGAGEPCSMGPECAQGHICAMDICTRSCESDPECPDRWACADAQIVRERLGISFEAGVVRICMPPGSLAADVKNTIRDATVDLPDQADEAALRGKLAAVTSAFIFGDTKADPEQVEAAWERIPEEKRRSASVEELTEAVKAELKD